MARDDEVEELQAAVEARRDLGRGYEDAVLESFLDKVDRSIAERVDARVAQRLDSGAVPVRREASGDPSGNQLALAIVSLGTGIPITAIAGGTSGTPGVIAAWAGIAGVNAALAWSRKR